VLLLSVSAGIKQHSAAAIDLLLLLLRRPEPYEFMESAGKMKLERVASTAAHK
jgi:hypothetical protein